jgi:hypothetical protein
VSFTLLVDMKSDLYTKGILIDIDHASIRMELPWGNVFGKEIIAFINDLD